MTEMIPFVGPHTDIMTPDMGTNEQVMAWFMDTYSMHYGHTIPEIVTGKPVVLGGTVGRREATGRGVAYLVARAMERLGLHPGEATAVVQGFGNVGSVTAMSLADRGVRIVGLGDHTAAFYDANGLDVQAAAAHVRAKGVLKGLAAEAIDPNDLLTRPCTVLVPAAVERVITGANAGQLHCRILAEAANGPTTPEADAILNQREDEIFVIPDILCNAGGVIVSYFEWVQDLQSYFWDESEITDRLHRALERAFQRTLRRAESDGISNRNAALAIGVEKVRDAKMKRGLFP